MNRRDRVRRQEAKRKRRRARKPEREKEGKGEGLPHRGESYKAVEPSWQLTATFLN